MTPAGPGNRLLPLDGGTNIIIPMLNHPFAYEATYPATLTGGGDIGVAGTISGEEFLEVDCLCSDGDVDGILNMLSSCVPQWFVLALSVFRGRFNWATKTQPLTILPGNIG